MIFLENFEKLRKTLKFVIKLVSNLTLKIFLKAVFALKYLYNYTVIQHLN